MPAFIVGGLASACGVPGNGHVRTVSDDSVPYHLLQADASTGGPTTNDSAPELVPVVFWVERDDSLAPAAVGGSCADPTEELVTHQLNELAAGPAEEVRSAGGSSALPPTPGLHLLGVVNRTARVEMDPSTSISAERLPLAVGQVVLSLTSTPGIERVTFLNAGEPVQVPLPGGALTARAVSARDYAALLVHRFRDSRGHAPGLSPTIGCPGS
jgi:spore germination protein GerM